jgi:hypothetical protein
VVLLSDGENDTNTSQATAGGSLTAAAAARLPVFTIGFGDAPDEGYLSTLALGTQGQYRSADAIDVLGVYNEIAALLRSQYVVTMTSAAPPDGRDTQVRITAVSGGAPLSATANYTRGTAPAAVPTTLAPTAVSPAAPQADEGGSGVGGVAVAVAVVAAALGAVALVGLLLLSMARRRRQRRRALAVVAANPALAAAQGLPELITTPPAETNGDARGRLLALTGALAGRAYEFGPVPLTIGSEPETDVVLSPSDEIAGRHAAIWIKDGKIMLRHLGGGRRTTRVDGKAVSWVILEDGDEFDVGGHRYRAERA